MQKCLILARKIFKTIIEKRRDLNCNCNELIHDKKKWKLRCIKSHWIKKENYLSNFSSRGRESDQANQNMCSWLEHMSVSELHSNSNTELGIWTHPWNIFYITKGRIFWSRRIHVSSETTETWTKIAPAG